MNINITTLVIPLLSIFGSVILSVLGSFLYLRQAKIDLKKEYEKRFNEKRWNTYNIFTENVIKVIKLLSEEHDNSINDLNLGFQKFVAEFLLVGSDAVVTSYKEWRVLSHVNGPRERETMEALFNVVIEMRKDLGNQYTKVKLQDLLGMIVPNYRRSL
ncbi:MAG TPA: hypothetical protein VIL99_02680 [Ignavibacteria bacterium]